jgi:hypothetical protein
VTFLEVVFDVEPKSHYQINNNGASKGEKRSVDEIQANPAGTDSKPIAKISTNAKGLLLYNITNSLHAICLKLFSRLSSSNNA